MCSDNCNNNEKPWIYGLGIIGLICFCFFLDCVLGPQHQSQSGIGETFQGKELDPWEREIRKNQQHSEFRQLQ
jgi:hypothetical protein